jgi:hypothetical protein
MRFLRFDGLFSLLGSANQKMKAKNLPNLFKLFAQTDRLLGMSIDLNLKLKQGKILLR